MDAVKGFMGARSRGRGLPYSVAAGLGSPLGVNAEAMEHDAAIGNTRGILGEAAVPTTAALAPLAVEGLVRGGTALRSAAMMDPDVAAAKALRTGGGAKALRSEANVDTARPYLKGAQNLEDLQSRIPAAKSEIWKPYSDAVDQVGHVSVDGPDGPSTVRELEQERLKTSAQLSAARNMKPTDLQTAIQKDQSIAELTKRDAAIKGAIDPELRKTGIDPGKIRQTFGGVKGIEASVSGRSTLTETPRKYGFGKMGNIQLTRPSTWIGQPLSGVRDLVAGRPLFSGAPTDVAVREGFRTGGEKPNLAPFAPTIQQRPIRGLLGPGATPLGMSDEPLTGPSAPQPTDLGIRASRLGLQLPERAGASRPLITPLRMDPIEPPTTPMPTRFPLAENRQLPPAGGTGGPRTVEGSTPGVLLYNSRGLGSGLNIESLSDAIVKSGQDPIFAERRAKQLIDADSGKSGYTGAERRAARMLIDSYTGPERRNR